MVLAAQDSSMLSGTTTDPEGNFTLKNLTSGDYILKVTYVGHQPMYKHFAVEGRSLGLGLMLLKPSATQLQAVEVVAKRAVMKQQGDTTVYFASAVNTGPDATARQLINKMPGIHARSGQYQAQGEDILEITVDGKRFFEGDLETALKMLPAESIEQVEVFDYQSERARLTGIDEGGTGKMINIVTKPSFRQSVFGRAYLGGGSEGAYQGGGNINMINDNQRVSVLYQGNNINQQNFAQEDVSEISGAALSEQAGISKVQAGGVDFSKTGEKTEISGTYLLHSNINNNISELDRTYIQNQAGQLQHFESADDQSKSLAHDFNLRLQHELSDRSTILFQPRLNHNNYESQRDLDTRTLESGTMLSTSASELSGIGGGTDFSAPVNFTHRFLKPRRTFSADFTPAYHRNSGESWLASQQTMFNDSTDFDAFYQEGRRNSEQWNLNAGLHYSEPISDKSTLYLHWNGAMNHEQSDEKVFRNGISTDEGGRPDSLLSNKFNGRSLQTGFRPEFLYRTKVHQIKIGLEYAITSLVSEQLFPTDYTISRSFAALLPRASWRVKIGKGKKLNMNYHTSNRAPSAYQLQTVADNSNPMRQYAGNEHLKQELRHSFSANYFGNNFEKGSVFMFGLNLSVIDDFYANTITTTNRDTLIDNRIFLQRGGQLMRTENLDGYFMLSIYTSIDHQIDWLSSNFSAGISLSHTRMPGSINGRLNWANSRLSELNLGLTSNISERLDFEVTSTSSYETVLYSTQKASRNHIFRQETAASLTWEIWKGLTFNSDVRHLMLRSNDDFFNRNILLCNLGLGYRFLKNKQAEFRITVFDLFNQNTSVRRSINELYTDNYSNNVMNRYTMLTFTYRLINTAR